MTTKRWLQLVAFTMTLTAVSLIILIASGTFDPGRMENRVWQRGPLNLAVAGGERETIWLTDVPEGDFEVHTAVAHQNGELDSGAGLVIEGECGQLLVASSPLGYATVQHSPTTSVRCSLPTDIPWQPWPHIKTGSESNELWLEAAEGLVTVRVNREILWQAAVEIEAQQLGIFAESFGGETEFEFQTIELFTN